MRSTTLYDTSRMRIYCIIPPFHLITNNTGHQPFSRQLMGTIAMLMLFFSHMLLPYSCYFSVTCYCINVINDLLSCHLVDTICRCCNDGSYCYHYRSECVWHLSQIPSQLSAASPTNRPQPKAIITTVKKKKLAVAGCRL